MIEAVLSSTQHPEYGEVSISFPILRKEYDHTIELLEGLGIGDALAQDCRVAGLDSFCKGERDQCLAIQNSEGDGDVGKDLIPLRKGLVGGEYGGGLLIPPGDELEEQIGPLNIHRKVTDLVDYEHPVFGKDFELVRQAVLKMGLFKLLNKLVAVDVVGGEAVLGRHQAQGRGQVGFAHSGRPKEYHVLPILQEAHGGQLVDLALVNRGLEGKIEVIQCLLDGKPGHLNLLLIGPFPLGFGFF